MRKIIAILTWGSLIAILLLLTLIAIQLFNPINAIKYLIALNAVFLTFFTILLLLRADAINPALKFGLIFFISLPAIVPLIGLVNPAFSITWWEPFVGGSIFQIGTAVYILCGGFKSNPQKQIFKLINKANYILYILLAVTLLLHFDFLLFQSLILIIGIIITLLSVILIGSMFQKNKVEL